ncbi:MAG TPA: acyltransferase domain-containing protein, partial [Blastocatellia bacterium]|nr:acyltransferase domain-containing protein [Blastocatellia bacterium]
QSACRLAIVAGSVDELSKKLAQGMKKLAAPDCARIKDRSGIFFFEQPLGREGKLAFMFPGYGSEYVNMLADLCMHFPEVRSHFDNLDKVFLHSRREPLPSQVLFPPPMAQATAEASAEELFAKVAFGSSAMCTGGLALLDLLTRLELRPDAVVGHSNGEFAALLAAGAIDLEGEEQFIEHALRAQSLYDSFAEQIPTAKVLAIGGGDPALVASLIAESGGALQMTIDNCPHQVVVCGPAEAIASATEYLQARGVICTVMPFDHAVHSPLFQPICDQIAAAHHSLNIVPPRIPVYSCTTAQAHAPDPAQIRPLIMNHLARPVRFRETIENMYEAGVRLFVEVGPKSNLTSFVNDTLSDRRFVAVPSNAANRSGITQLNHLIGLLVAHHVTMRLDHLYARRSPNRVSLDSAGERSPSRSAKPRSVKLSLEYPLLKLRSDGRASLPASSATTEEMVSEPIHKANGQTRPTGIGPRPAVQTVPPGYRNGNGHKTHLYPSAHGHAFNDKRQTRGNGRGARARVMNEYLQTMGQFLAMQQAVVGTFLAESAPASHGNGPRKTLPAAAAPHAPAPQGPFRLVVQSLVAGRELAATCHFDLSEHLFLRDHTLGRSPAATDETLLALPVVPLTINMEMMAQAASLLVPGKRLVAMKQLRSYRWIDVDERGRTLALTAKVKSTAPAEIEVRVTGADGPSRADESSLLLEGTMIFADAYPPAPRPEASAERPRRPYHLRPEQYYDSMFHGQCFRSVVSVDQFDRDSIQATLKNPPHAQLFRSADSAGLLTAPVLLDGAGQTIGFWLWTLDGFEEGAATFPVGFESLHFYAPPEYGSEPITCAARIDQLAHERTRADIDLIGPRGELLARLRAWEDVRAMGWTQR